MLKQIVVNTAQPSVWHALSVENIWEVCKSQISGLSHSEAENRIAEYGYNLLRKSKKRGWFKRLISQFNTLILILSIAGILTFFLGKHVDTSVIFAVVFIDVIIGFLQEGKAERAIDTVSQMLSSQAWVIRDGKRLKIPAEHLVPGDVVILQSGDKVPADIRLFQVKNLRISEASLTGESEPVEKNTDPLPEGTVLGDRTNMAFSSTLVTYGMGQGVVIGTGDHTEIGRISGLLAQTQELVTPLLLKIKKFSKWVSLFVISMVAFVFLYGILIAPYTLEEMVISAVGIAVAAIPEVLPVIFTVTLAIGVQRMARRHAIIRRLPAVETLGSVMVVCTDKTGTLTCNEMTVTTVCLGDNEIKVSGSGYQRQGEFFINSQPINPDEHSDLQELCRAAVLCSNADFQEYQSDQKIQGDPTEIALLILAAKAKIDVDTVRHEFPQNDLVPFESAHKFMATLHHDHVGHKFIYVKGAPEVILQRCHMQRHVGEDRPLNLQYWQRQVQALAEKGQRTLALAFKTAPADQSELTFNDLEGGLVLLGITGMLDPPRIEAANSVRECQEAGIRVKMITGDHAITAKAIAQALGISHARVLSGEQLDVMTDQEISELIDTVDIFARASAELKLRLVNVLQAKGYVVAMTGDGVNDAPALKRANIGVAMGLKGTEAAREAAEMVLTDDNFSSIVDAIKEGRTVYDNLKKALMFILPINGGESLALIVAILLHQMLPITPVQILWVNMVSSSLLTLALAFEPSETNIMRRQPLPPNEPLLSKIIVWRIIFVSTIFLLGIFGIFQWELARGENVTTARTAAVSMLVSLEVIYLFSSRYLHGPSLTIAGIRGSKLVFLFLGIVFFLQLAFIYLPPFQGLFNTAALSLTQIATIAIVGIVAFVIVEAEKLLTLRFSSFQKTEKISR